MSDVEFKSLVERMSQQINELRSELVEVRDLVDAGVQGEESGGPSPIIRSLFCGRCDYRLSVKSVVSINLGNYATTCSIPN